MAARSAKRVNVLKYRGIIVQRALHKYNMLPMNAKAWIGLDDLVNEGIVCAIEALPKWDARRGAASTFLHVTVDNHLQNFIKAHHCMKRDAPVFSLDEEPAEGYSPLAERLGKTSRYAEVLDAKKKVAELHRRASNDLVAFLDQNLFHREGRVTLRGKRFNRCQREFQQLVARTGVTMQQYRIVVALEQR